MEDADISIFSAQQYAEDMADIDAMIYGSGDEIDFSCIED